MFGHDALKRLLRAGFKQGVTITIKHHWLGVMGGNAVSSRCRIE
jgi:hypothetical protein